MFQVNVPFHLDNVLCGHIEQLIKEHGYQTIQALIEYLLQRWYEDHRHTKGVEK